MQHTRSCNVHLLVLDLLGSLSGQLLNDGSIDDLVVEVGIVTDNAELELLLLLLHFLLRLEKDLDDVGQGLLDSQLAEVLLLNFVSGELLSSSTGAAVVLVAGTGGLNHKETETLEVVVKCESHGGAIRALTGINSVHLDLHAKTLSENSPWDLNAEHFLVLLSLLSGSVHERLAIRDESVDNAASFCRNGEDSLVGA